MSSLQLSVSVGCEAAKSANPAAPSATVVKDAVAVNASRPRPQSPARIDAPDRDGPGRTVELQQSRFLRRQRRHRRHEQRVPIASRCRRPPTSARSPPSSRCRSIGTRHTMMSLGIARLRRHLLLARERHRRQHRIDLLEHVALHDAERTGCVAVDRPGGVNRFRRHGRPSSGSTYFFALVAQKGGPMVSDDGMRAMRDELGRAWR